MNSMASPSSRCRSCSSGEVVDALAVEHHLAGGDVEETQDAATHRGFSAPRFAHQREGLGPVDGEGDAIHRVHGGGTRPERTRMHEEVLLEVVDLEQRAGHAASASLGA
jgi:hypothetical protein